MSKRTVRQAAASLDAMWAQVDAIRNKLNGEVLPEKPEGWFSEQEYIQRHDTRNRQASSFELARMVRQGKLIRKRAYCPRRDGKLSAQNIYKLTGK